MTDLTHIRENNEDSQQHLDSNREKFETDAMFLLKQMMRGERLSAKTVVQKYGCESRRLREIFSEGKCEKVWVTDTNGKRKFVEYFITPPKPISKTELCRLVSEGNLIQQKLFTNP